MICYGTYKKVDFMPRVNSYVKVKDYKKKVLQVYKKKKW